MKKILNALFLTLLAVFTFSSCSDVPAPYDILGEGDVPGLTGDGTKENPYTVSDLKAKADGTTVAWVQAYIVAGIKSSTDMSISSENDVVFGTQPTGVKATAFLIADDSGESDYKNCSAVNLSGKTAGCSEVKAALNLVDNAATPLPRLVTLKGTLVKNTWGLPGLKEVTTVILEDGTIIGEGGAEPTPPVGGVIFFEESFASDKGAFTIEDKTRPTQVSEIWKWESYTPQGGGTASKYMKASAFISTTEKKASESWLISPVVNLTKATKASLTFEHAHKFCGDPAKELTIWVKESTASDWTQATIPTYGTNQNWTFVSSGNIDLAGYIGKNIQFAFKYISTTSNVGTWEVKNVKIVGEGEGGGEVPSGDDPFGLDASNPKTTFEANFEDITEQNKNYTLEGWVNKAIQATNVWQTATYNSDKYIKATPYNVAADATMEAWFITPAFTVNSANKFTFDCAGANWKEDMKLKVFFLQKDLNGTVSKNEVTISQIPTSGTNYEWVRDINVDLSNYNGKVGFVGFQYTVISTGVNKSLPTYQIDNVKYGTGGGGIEPDPTPSDKYSSNITLPEGTSTDANKASGGAVVIAEKEYPILKLGTGKAIGSWNSPALQAGASKLSFFAVGWSGKKGQLTVVIEGGGTFEGGEENKVISLNGETAGVTGNPPFTITPADTDFYEYTMTGITASSTIKFTTDGTTGDKRAIIFGINIK